MVQMFLELRHGQKNFATLLVRAQMLLIPVMLSMDLQLLSVSSDHSAARIVARKISIAVMNRFFVITQSTLRLENFITMQALVQLLWLWLFFGVNFRDVIGEQSLQWERFRAVITREFVILLVVSWQMTNQARLVRKAVQTYSANVDTVHVGMSDFNVILIVNFSESLTTFGTGTVKEKF